MTQFQAYEFTDLDLDAPVLGRVREHYGDRVYWRRVYASRNLKGPGPFNLAAIARAAEHQGQRRADAVLERLRQATGEDVSELLADVPGLDVWRLLRDLDSESVRWSIEADRRLARRYETLPTLLLRGPGGDRVVSGVQPFAAYVRAVEAVTFGFAEAA